MVTPGRNRVSVKSKRLRTVRPRERAQSDQATQVAARALGRPTARRCSSAFTTTTPLYSTGSAKRYEARILNSGAGYSGSIVVGSQAHYQLDGVMVRVSRDTHVVDHTLDQE